MVAAGGRCAANPLGRIGSAVEPRTAGAGGAKGRGVPLSRQTAPGRASRAAACGSAGSALTAGAARPCRAWPCSRHRRRRGRPNRARRPGTGARVRPARCRARTSGGGLRGGLRAAQPVGGFEHGPLAFVAIGKGAAASQAAQQLAQPPRPRGARGLADRAAAIVPHGLRSTPRQHHREGQARERESLRSQRRYRRPACGPASRSDPGHGHHAPEGIVAGRRDAVTPPRGQSAMLWSGGGLVKDLSRIGHLRRARSGGARGQGEGSVPWSR